MRKTKFIILSAVLATASALAAAQAEAPAVKHVPITSSTSNSGMKMFNDYCAVCHGKDGMGAGPAAPAMKAPPTDLTLLAQKNGGKYPSAHVAAVLRGQATTVAHGSHDMPVWGPLFSSISEGHEAQVEQRIANLVHYIETLQAK